MQALGVALRRRLWPPLPSRLLHISAGEPAGFIGGEEGDDIGDIGRRPTRRSALQEATIVAKGRTVSAWAISSESVTHGDRVDGDPPSAEFVRDGTRIGLHAGL